MSTTPPAAPQHESVLESFFTNTGFNPDEVKAFIYNTIVTGEHSLLHYVDKDLLNEEEQGYADAAVENITKLLFSYGSRKFLHKG